METNRTEISAGLFTSTIKCTASFERGSEGNGSEGSLFQHIFFIEDHGRNDVVMKVRKQAGWDIKFGHQLSDWFSPVLKEQDDYIELIILSVLFSDVLGICKL